MIPFVNLQAQHAPLKAEIMRAFEEVLDTCAFSGGPYVEKFEKEFSSYCDTRFCTGVASGTHALWLALLALGVGRGDEVITVPNTFIATAEAIAFTGATPIFVDVDEETYNLDPRQLEQAITPRTKAIIPVHLYGQMADMDSIMEIAGRRKLWVIEDAAQAHGAEYKGRRAGSIGHIGCFSFYPAKNLGACGEAGACVTNDPVLHERISMLRDHGQSRKYEHRMLGWNGRMDGIQAAVLSVKLKRLDSWTEARRSNAIAYNSAFAKVSGLLTPKEAAHRKHVYHLYVLRLKNRDEVRATLAQRGIQCAVHYPVPLHMQEPLRKTTEGEYHIAERCAREFLSLPVSAELSTSEQSHVIEAVVEVLAEVGQPCLTN